MLIKNVIEIQDATRMAIGRLSRVARACGCNMPHYTCIDRRPQARNAVSANSTFGQNAFGLVDSLRFFRASCFCTRIRRQIGLS